MDRGTAEMDQMSLLSVHIATAQWDNSSVMTATVRAPISCATLCPIAQMAPMRIRCCVPTTNVRLTSGSVPISDVSLRRGSVMETTIVETTQTRKAPTVSAGPAIQDSLNATMAAAFHRAGSVTWMTTVGITQMNPSMNAWDLLTAAIITQILTAEQTIAVCRSGPCAMAMMTAGTTAMSKAARY